MKIDSYRDRKMYCLCSDKSFGDIINYQSKALLPFKKLLSEYTSCTSTGCGSCIEPLKIELEQQDLLFNESTTDAG